MQFSHLLLRALVPCFLIQVVIPQELPFEIPVQLVGFPIIILAVRLSNFLKKLSYAVNPGTYRSRARRGLEQVPLNIVEIEKKLIQEMGSKVCVYEDICQEYADKVNHDQNFILDWQDIFKHYEKFPGAKKEFYLLSVFMGDIVKSRELCSQLAKRGRSCNSDSGSHFKEDRLKLQQSHRPDEESLKQIQEQKSNFYNHSSNLESFNRRFNESNKSEYHQPHSVHRLNSSDRSRTHSVSGNVHTPAHHQNRNHHHSGPHHLKSSQVHRQVHHHHVEVHYDSEGEKNQGLLFGQHFPHQIHHTSSRIVN